MKTNYNKMTDEELFEQAEILMDKMVHAYNPNELEGVLLEVGM